MKIKIVCVDLQNDFASPRGKHYALRPSVSFIADTLMPFLREHSIKITEIISDYRQPRPGDLGDCCNPGTFGYGSQIPDDVKLKPVWIKCMNSPIWTRNNIGDPGREPGLPYQDPKAFTKWLSSLVGKPKDLDIVVLIGLTLDCCVLSTAQELRWRGYKVRVLSEATDTSSGSRKEKSRMLKCPPFTNWARSISWSYLRAVLRKTNSGPQA